MEGHCVISLFSHLLVWFQSTTVTEKNSFAKAKRGQQFLKGACGLWAGPDVVSLNSRNLKEEVLLTSPAASQMRPLRLRSSVATRLVND